MSLKACVNVFPFGVTRGSLPTCSREITDDLPDHVIAEAVGEAIRRAKTENFDVLGSPDVVIAVTFRY